MYVSSYIMSTISVQVHSMIIAVDVVMYDSRRELIGNLLSPALVTTNDDSYR